MASYLRDVFAGVPEEVPAAPRLHPPPTPAPRQAPPLGPAQAVLVGAALAGLVLLKELLSQDPELGTHRLIEACTAGSMKDAVSVLTTASPSPSRSPHRGQG